MHSAHGPSHYFLFWGFLPPLPPPFRFFSGGSDVSSSPGSLLGPLFEGPFGVAFTLAFDFGAFLGAALALGTLGGSGWFASISSRFRWSIATTDLTRLKSACKTGRST